MNDIIVKNMLQGATELILENIDYLTELDGATGDGDHGVTMNKIAKKINSYFNTVEKDKPLYNALDDLSWELMNINGGSAGLLWGAFFEGMAIGARQPFSSDDEQLKNIFMEGYKNFSQISGAVTGQKTMMDAIYPATMVLENEEGSFKEMAQKMAKEAVEGADATRDMIAKFGRAKSLKEASIGHKDPGAVSFSLFYMGIVKGLNI